MKNLGQVFKAVVAAMVGFGRKEDLIKDFERAEKQGAWVYIIVGLLMTILFIFAVIAAVKFALLNL